MKCVDRLMWVNCVDASSVNRACLTCMHVWMMATKTTKLKSLLAFQNYVGLSNLQIANMITILAMNLHGVVLCLRGSWRDSVSLSEVWCFRLYCLCFGKADPPDFYSSLGLSFSAFRLPFRRPECSSRMDQLASNHSCIVSDHFRISGMPCDAEFA